MNQPFEQLVIQELKGIKDGQSDMIRAFDEHKDVVNQKFIDLALKSAEAAGEAKAKAKLWSLGGVAFTTIFAGSYEALKHYFQWK